MVTMPGVSSAATLLGATTLALLFFAAANKAEGEEPQQELHQQEQEHQQEQHPNHPDLERILQMLEHNERRMAEQLHEWKNKTENVVNALLAKEAEWKERTEAMVSALLDKDEEWKNRTEGFITSLLEKDAGRKNDFSEHENLLQSKNEGCSNVTESLVTSILDKESEWVTRSETLIQDTDNLKKLVRGLLFREAEAKKKIIALTTMVRNLLTFSGVARCETPFKVVPYVGCIFLDREGSTFTEGRARCQEMDADIFIAETSTQFLHLSTYYKNHDPGNTDIWVGVRGGLWLNGREPEKEEWVPGDPDDGSAGCGHLEAWSRWNNTPRRFLLSDHLCSGKAWTVCQKRP